MMLTGKQINDSNVITDAVDLSIQTQSCGIDLTVARIERFIGRGVVDFDNSRRARANLVEVVDWDLCPGCYLVTFNETVSIPPDVAGIARPRSTLLRNGATMETALFDPGYKGKSQCLLVVHNPYGIRIFENARLMQIVFVKLLQDAEKLYSGVYQNENL